MEKYESDVVKGALELAADCIPTLAIVVHALQFPQTISDAIFMNKLRRLLNKQDNSILEWLKIEWKFESDQNNYAENVRKLIYLLDSMREDQSINAYANLLHAYQYGLIDRDTFFRLSWILSQVYYDDLLLLREVYDNPPDDQKEPDERLLVLEPYGVLDRKPRLSFKTGTAFFYSLNQLGLEMIACGLDFDHYEKYKLKKASE